MTNFIRWYRRIAVSLTMVMMGVFLPTAAWAQSDSTMITATETLAKGKAVVAVGIGGLCCLAVIGVIVGVVVMIIRRRR